MDINKVLMEYDSMFGKNTLEEIENYLVSNIEAAYEEPDYYSAVTLLNEFIGFCRDTSQNEKGKECCNQTIILMNRLGLGDTVEYATSMLNVANAYRAFGMFQESLDLYSKVENNYKKNLAPNEFNYASLYNNWSLLYQEMNDFDSAEFMLKKALRIVDRYPNATVEQATTRTNLAVTMFKISQEEKNGLHGKDREREAEATYREGMSYLKHALKIYENDGGKDFHYSAALTAMGDALYMKEDYTGASKNYSRAMAELEKHVGRTEAYDRIQEKYESAFRRSEMEMGAVRSTFFSEESKADEENDDDSYEEEQVKESADEKSDDVNTEDEASETGPEKKYFKNNMQRCRAFYREQGAPMINRLFPQYESKIAVGLVGEGSDCFGFDDEISMDHDYEVGFCMWLTDEDYDAISGRLQFEYENLLTKYGSYYVMQKEENVSEENSEAAPVDRFIDGRRGVFKISEFYNKLIFAYTKNNASNGISDFAQIPDSVWFEANDEGFAAATNGHVFRDDLGEFSRIRELLLNYYPRKVWTLKLAEELHNFSQYAQSNYERMMARNDYITAELCIAKASESAMRIAYILDKTYAPYYKWMRRGMNTLHKLKDVAIMLDNIAKLPCQTEAWTDRKYNPYTINENDAVVISFEAVARRIQGELVAAGLVTGQSTFLENYCQMIADSAMLGAGSDEFTDNDSAFYDESMKTTDKLFENGKVVNNTKASETEAYKGNDSVFENTEAFSNDSVFANVRSRDSAFSNTDDMDDSEFGGGKTVDDAIKNYWIERFADDKTSRRTKEITKEELVEDIIHHEWQQFDKVENEGGRADCQDDWNTFSLMRRSQYEAWDTDVLESYRNDLIDAGARGWNLITEKYARMMQSTAPEKYKELEDSLPERNEERIAIQEEIIRIQVAWMEEFAENFPKMAANSRSIHTSEDTEFNTSYETYLRGELGTYSDDTLILYGRFIVKTEKEGKNLAYIIMNNTAKGYGYASLAEAEASL